MVISFVMALTLMLAFIFGSPNVKRYKRDGLSFEESRFYCLHCTYCYISAKLHPSASARRRDRYLALALVSGEVGGGHSRPGIFGERLRSEGKGRAVAGQRAKRRG